MIKFGSILCTLLFIPALAFSAELPSKKFLTADGARPNGLFAPGIVVDKTVYIAGKGDYKPNEELAGKVRNCLNEVRKTLQVAGLDLNSVVHSFCYLEDPNYYPEFNKVYSEFFPNNPPACTTVGVPNVPGDSRIEITCIAYADPAGVKPVGTPDPGFPYSPGIIAGDMLYLSGKGDQLPGGGHPATFEEQVRQCLRNVQNTLNGAKLDLRNAVMIHLFLDNPENVETAAKVYREFFKFGSAPALSTVFVDWIPGGSHVEITCWAATDLKNRKAVRPANMKTLHGETLFPASPAVWAGNTLYLSAVSGFDPAAKALPDSLEQQVRRMAQNDLDILTAARLEFPDIVSGHVYLKTIDDYAPMNTVYKEFYSAGPGVRTCLMPGSGTEKNNVKVRASFIAAKTKK
jgi:2-iminobutanoate/2-iminopropanoate deaminase